MNIRCVIVEDEPLARKLISEYVNTTPNLTLVASFGNPLEALEFMRENTIDLLFSDIQMKEITGITLLKLLNKKPFVVLTTAYSEYALEGFELDVTDYLLKPITFERFLKAVEKVSQRMKNEKPEAVTVVSTDPANDFIFLKDGSKLLKVRLPDILYIQGLKDYVKVITTERQIVSLQTMKSLEETLPSNQFIRIHNSTIVAFDAIEEIERDKVKIGKVYLPVSDSYKKSFKEYIESKRI
ncbi:MAG: LytTR family DNA-binding domain-containing protein [Cytophagales bacterium]|nr:LytTR family DNA-binding domain-containing protein [Cytophagales bacterium]